ncbi:PepSY-associated TM helix domain-containing protein [uncultured Sunxiuqinia sp.]|uniref:PepSY-associated TM helix domain-containing protein n=1 Tax=uncultured Sunxiuqinia sp. TaxID=1573825 RepID=UPI0030D89C11|tara:strand:+ start:91925 stop:92479 length:555 start_codon:yes stop_codon:yes gene_type:complete
MKIRRLLRIWHRDLGYFITGLVLIYAVSGIALNHRKDWNPDYRVVSETMLFDERPWRAYSAEEIRQVLKLFDHGPVYKKHFNSNQKVVKIFIENGMIIYDPLNGTAEMELLVRRPVFYHINKLHMAATSKAWIWVSDILSVVLIFVSVSGLFLLGGKNGLSGRGWWLTLLGFIVPLFFLIFYIS